MFQPENGIQFKNLYLRNIFEIALFDTTFNNSTLSIIIKIPTFREEIFKTFSIEQKVFFINDNNPTIIDIEKEILITNSNHTEIYALINASRCLNWNSYSICFVQKIEQNENRCEIAVFLNKTNSKFTRHYCKTLQVPRKNIISNYANSIHVTIFHPMTINFQCGKRILTIKLNKHSII